MAIAFRSGQVDVDWTNYNGSPYETTTSLPSSPLEDSLLVVCAWGGATASTPSGYSVAVADTDGPGYLNRYIFYKVAGASESTDLTITWAADEEMGHSVHEFTGCDTTSPLDAATANSAYSTTNGAADFQPGTTGTLSNAESLVMTLMGLWSGDDKTFGITDSFTKNVDEHNAGSYQLGVAYKITSATTALNPTWSWTTSEDEVLAAIAAFKPADTARTTSGVINAGGSITATVRKKIGDTYYATRKIDTSIDDGHVDGGSFYNDGQYLWVGLVATETFFVRFDQLNLPADANISDARLTVYFDSYVGTPTVAASGSYYAQDEDDPIPFDSITGGSQPWGSRTQTTASVGQDFATNLSANDAVQSGDLSAIIQELVDSYSGIDAVLLFWEGTAQAGMEWAFSAFDLGTEAYYATLALQYTIGAATSGTINGGGSISATVVSRLNQVARPDSTVAAGDWDTGPTTGQNLHTYAGDGSDATYIEDTTV